MILGAPFDGGTSNRAGTRFGPQYIRQTGYLPHDGSRPSLAMRVDGLRDLRVYDAGDVEMFSGDADALGARSAGGGVRRSPATAPSRWSSAATTRSPGRMPRGWPSTSARAASR